MSHQQNDERYENEPAQKIWIKKKTEQNADSLQSISKYKTNTCNKKTYLHQENNDFIIYQIRMHESLHDSGFYQ